MKKPAYLAGFLSSVSDALSGGLSGFGLCRAIFPHTGITGRSRIARKADSRFRPEDMGDARRDIAAISRYASTMVLRSSELVADL